MPRPHGSAERNHNRGAFVSQRLMAEKKSVAATESSEQEEHRLDSDL